MEHLITSQNITFILGLIGVLFGVYHYFKNPQIKSEKEDIVMSAAVAQLAKDLANLRDNHIHSIDTKISEQDKQISLLTVQVTRLGTIIEERIPKRN